MSLGYKSNPVPFTNKGLVLREDPSLMEPGEYAFLENLFSGQEGSLTIRPGHKRMNSTPLGAPVTSISKLNLGGADANNPRYVGSGTNIYRSDPSWNLTSVFSGIASASRWSAGQYNAGASGKPSLYVATKDASLRDNGSYTTLQKWGIDAPIVPVKAQIQPPSQTSQTLILSTWIGNDYRFAANNGTNTYVNSNNVGVKTVSAMDAGPGYISITPTSASPFNGMSGIYQNMLIQIIDGVGGNETVVVLQKSATSFFCVTQFNHSAGNVTLMGGGNPNGQKYVNASPGGGDSPWNFTVTGLSIDASFGGTPSTGYSSNDPFVIGLRTTSVTTISNIQVRIIPNYGGTPPSYAGDYYFYNISPSASLTPVPYDPPTVPITADPEWVEFAIPKNSFSKQGNAGTGDYTWKNINQIQIVVTQSGATSTDNVGVSDMYFIGGGGLNSQAAGTVPYSWLYTYRNPISQQESNPCVNMIPANIPAQVLNGKVNLTLTGIDTSVAGGNSEISGAGSIAIYRAGGSFSDGLYRLGGYTANPGSGATTTYLDTASDQSLDTAPTIQFDNDPPVRSSLQIPLIANIGNFQPVGGGGGSPTGTANAFNRISLSNLAGGFNGGAIASIINYASQVTVGRGATTEIALISAAGSTGGVPWIECYLQYQHNWTGADPTEIVEIDAVNRGKCDLVHQDFDCVFLAGDANNPATLYQSKVGRPESFPVVNLVNGFAQQVNVGSPSNPINGITSLNGELVCLNQDDINIVQVWGGQMQQPLKSLSSRGLYAKHCFARGADRIWFLSYDGIYAWSGGDSQKISEPIDFMFRGIVQNGVNPIDFTQASLFSMEFARNNLFFCFVAVGGNYYRLRYDVSFNRWTLEDIYNGVGLYQMTAAFTEPDTGNLLFGIVPSGTSGYVWWADWYSTSDGWVNNPNDGLAIHYALRRDWPMGDPGSDYQVGEIVVELSNPSDAVTVGLYYNYGANTTEIMTVGSGALPSRGRFIRTVNSGTPQTCYAIGLQLSGFTGTGSSPVTFNTFSWRELALEQVTTGPTSDWTNLGYPYGKYLYDISIQYDTGGNTIPVILDVVGGITGNAQTLGVTTFTLSGSGRSQQMYTIPDQTIAKLVRLRPQFNGSLPQFKFWAYEFRKDNLPPDNITATPWDASGYPCDKVFKSLTLQVDTGGVDASVQLQVDGSTVNTFTVNSTFNDRARIITLPSNIIGKEWRLVPTPGGGGKFQLYGAQADFQKEPCAITHFDSLEQVLGFVGYKYLWQVWLEYICPSSVTFAIYRDTGSLFYQVTLPPHTVRSQERFYLPSYNAGTGQLNKSKIYRFTLDSSSPFKMYSDGSRVESQQLSGDQRSGFEQHVISEEMPLVR